MTNENRVTMDFGPVSVDALVQSTWMLRCFVGMLIDSYHPGAPRRLEAADLAEQMMIQLKTKSVYEFADFEFDGLERLIEEARKPALRLKD